MLIRLFSSIRQKPKEVRDQYALLVAVVVTGLVAIPWVFGLPGQLTNEASDVASEPIFSSFFNEATGRLSEATKSIDDVHSLDGLAATSSNATTTAETGIDFVASSSTSTAPKPDPRKPVREVRIATTTTSFDSQ